MMDTAANALRHDHLGQATWPGSGNAGNTHIHGQACQQD